MSRSIDGPVALKGHGWLGLGILLLALASSAAIAVRSHGHILFIGLPLLSGVPLAGMFGCRR